MTPVHLAAVCDATAPICPKCGKPVVARLMVRPGGALGTCVNYTQGTASDDGPRACSQKLVILDNSGGMCTVLGVGRREFDALLADLRPLREALGELGVLTRASLN